MCPRGSRLAYAMHPMMTMAMSGWPSADEVNAYQPAAGIDFKRSCSYGQQHCRVVCVWFGLEWMAGVPAKIGNVLSNLNGLY